jgi:hypothetical protein
MVGVAQLVRAPDCGSGGRGFETRHSPHSSPQRNHQRTETFSSARKSWLKWAHEHVEGLKALRFPLNDAGLARITHDASTASADTQL